VVKAAEKTCDECSKKSNIIQMTMKMIHEEIKASPLWTHSDAQEITIALEACQRSLMELIPIKK
jgi:hypothetical protein